MAEEIEISAVTYEQLASIEDEFEAVDLEIVRQQYNLSKPLYEKRKKIISEIPNFWALTLEQSPPEIDAFITPEDSRLFAEYLENIEVTRPDLENGKNGHPRSFTIRFEFKENDVFDNKVLEKTFTYRRSKSGWAGSVSEPVKINWKSGKDLTAGLTDLAVNLFAARQKSGNMADRKLPEYEALKSKVESWNAANTSFFTWFGFVSEYRYVSAEEDAAAIKAYAEKKPAAGEDAEMDEDDDEDDEDDDDEEVEVCESGEDLAIAIAEDLWPNAIKYFTGNADMDDMSELDFEEMDEDDSDEDDEATDMRDIVGNGTASNKRARK